MKPVCFIDLDGVLVDFVAGALKVHRATIPPHEVEWDFNRQIGLTPAKFWAPMDAEFWANLRWTAEGQELLLEVERIFGDNVVIMTSPCKAPGGVEGKIEWIRRNMPNYSRKFFVGPEKHMAAGPGKILLDDHDNNVRKFIRGGGFSVLVPRPWNVRKSETFGAGQFSVPTIAAELSAFAAICE